MSYKMRVSKQKWVITLLVMIFVTLTCLGGLFLQRTTARPAYGGTSHRRSKMKNHRLCRWMVIYLPLIIER